MVIEAIEGLASESEGAEGAEAEGVADAWLEFPLAPMALYARTTKQYCVPLLRPVAWTVVPVVVVKKLTLEQSGLPI
jgi:hypothetical protein